MKSFEITANTGRSLVVVGERFQNLMKYVDAPKAVIITDTKVRRHYGRYFPPFAVIEIGAGEKIKNLDTVRYVYHRLLSLDVDRSSFVVGIGGGIVCDIAGFAASTYMRGIRFGFVATTLLAQVDASTGGKNGVNFRGYKNLVGVFHQPEFVLCDPDLLRTLPQQELACGFAEIVKHAAIADADLLAYIEKNCQEALSLERDVIEELIHASVRIKSDIVTRDEKERGERRILNFGHTFGHAIEKAAGVRHGEAVSVGMVMASRLSARKGYLTQEDVRRIESLLVQLGLPIRLPLDGKKVLDALVRDKKREADKIHFVLLRGLGCARIEEISISDLASVLDMRG